MKKIIALLLAALMIFALAACGENNMTETTDIGNSEVAISGGWGAVESPVVTDDLKAVVKKACDGLDGETYIPVVNVASQIVAGTNHLILCKTVPASADGSSVYALVTIYEDLEGNAEITAVAKSTMEAPVDGLMGGWTEPETPEVTPQAKAAFDQAKKAFDTESFDPIALVATQLVSGTNYALLCESSPNARGSEANYNIYVVYEDLQGNARITGIYNFIDENAELPASSTAE